MALTAVEKTDLEAKLVSLEKAHDDFVMGKRGVSVTYDGYSVTLNRTNIGLIKGRIREIKRALGQVTARRSFGTCY